MSLSVNVAPGVCSNCGHASAARCSVCGREMLCGKSSNVLKPCPRPGCGEMVLVDLSCDLEGGPVEAPRLS